MHLVIQKNKLGNPQKRQELILIIQYFCLIFKNFIFFHFLRLEFILY